MAEAGERRGADRARTLGPAADQRPEEPPPGGRWDGGSQVKSSRRLVRRLVAARPALARALRRTGVAASPSASNAAVASGDAAGPGGSARRARRRPRRRACPAAAGSRAAAPASRRGPFLARPERPRHRGLHGLHLFRREVAVGDALAEVLDVDAREVARGDGAEDDAGAVLVEQRERGALLAAGVAEGVVADDRAIGERVVEVTLLVVELVGEDLDGLAQVAHLRVQVLGVRDDVALLVVPEHDRLGAPQPADARHEHDDQDEQDEREDRAPHSHVRGDVAQGLHHRLLELQEELVRGGVVGLDALALDRAGDDLERDLLAQRLLGDGEAGDRDVLRLAGLDGGDGRLPA